jgi:squalene-hopene/tetraprenyl-beta-curcumene cyclase
MKPRALLPFLFVPLVLVDAFSDEPKATPAPKPKPEWQYNSGDIRISIPTAAEPKVSAFGPESIRAAAKYLDDGAVAWMREKSCVACHTPGSYMLDRPMLTRHLGKPSEEVLGDFVDGIPAKPPASKESKDVTYFPGADREVWRTAGLAQWDKHVTGKLSEHTDRALRSMLLYQSSHGGYLSPGSVEIPYVTTDFELTLHAVRALVDAPGWLANLKDADLLQRIEHMKTFLRETQPRNDYERALRIDLAAMWPELVRKEDHAADVAMLWSKQKVDGGWCTRDMSDTRNWRTPMTDTVVKLVEALPDAANPGSDPYMTALAIVLLRESGVPASDPRLERGVAWLKAEQRVSGRWWMDSLYRGNYEFITYIATAKAMQALAMCGELPELAGQP